MQNETKKTYEQPEVRSLGSYVELTQTDRTAPTLDGGICGCGSVSGLS